MRQRNRRRRALRAESAADEGVTLVEVVISIALMGVVVVPLLLAVATSVKGSRVSESSAEVETLLVNAVDRVNRATQGDFPCDVANPVKAAVETVGWDPNSAVIVHEYLDEITGLWVAGPGNTACPASGFYNGIVQRVTITITDPHERVSRTLQVVRGDI